MPALSHYWDKIDWSTFDFQDFYARMVQEAPDPAHFVEVGVWLGKSIAFLGVEIINSGKKIQVDAVDTWQGSVGELTFSQYARENDVYATFLENVKPLGDVVKPIKTHSRLAAQLYEDASLDLVFIDASHDYISVSEDIDNWKPKVKKGGIIAGHDWDTYQSVNWAVKAHLKSPLSIEGHVWWSQIQ